MHTLKLKVQDGVFDKIMYFLQNLPKNEVEIVEDKVITKKEPDFIEYLLANPVSLKTEFLSRNEANAR